MDNNKYFLYANLNSEKIEKEVSLKEYCEAERRAGFYPKMASSHPEFMTTPATGAFGNGDRGGRIKYN